MSQHHPRTPVAAPQAAPAAETARPQTITAPAAGRSRTSTRPSRIAGSSRSSARAGRAARSTARLRRVGGVVALGLGLAVLPTAADAHVRVIPESTVAGGWSALTFRVPNESATAVTTSLVVDLPTDTPFLSVSVRPVPGWTATIEKAPLDAPVESHGTTLTEAPARVVWTATPGAEIGDGQFQEFEISAGPLPEEAGVTLVLPAHQGYSDGTVVSWDEAPTGGGEPEHPAPVLTTTAAPDADDASGDDAVEGDEAVTAAGGADDGDGTVTAADADTDATDTVARVLGGAGLLLGLSALVVAVVTSLRRRGTA